MTTVTANVYKALSKSITLTNNTIKALLEEPLLTGPLLYILTRGPAHLRARVLRPFQTNLLSKDAAQRLEKLITTLKVLFVIGLGKRVNAILNGIALNNWHAIPWRKPGRQFVWDGKTETVILTGGASGFGYEMVKLFAGRARIVVLDVQNLPAELTSLPEVHYYKCDLTDFEAISSVSAQIKTRFGNPTVLINNAGIGAGKSIIETSPEFLDKIMRVNLMSHFVLIKEFVPGMMEEKKGHVVAICSMASFVSAGGLVDYCVTKVGAMALVEGLRNELLSRYANQGGRTIQTTTVHPSWHATGILGGDETTKRLAQFGIVPDPPINVAREVVDQIIAGRSGKIIVPKTEESRTKARASPLWVYDLGVKNVQFPWSKKSFHFGDDESGKSVL